MRVVVRRGRPQSIVRGASAAALALTAAISLAATASASGTSAARALHEADARIDGVSDGEVTLTHGPFATLGMPAMTMDLRLANPEVAAGLKVGDRVRVVVRASESGLVVEKLRKLGDAK